MDLHKRRKRPPLLQSKSRRECVELESRSSRSSLLLHISSRRSAAAAAAEEEEEEEEEEKEEEVKERLWGVLQSSDISSFSFGSQVHRHSFAFAALFGVAF